MATTTTHSQTRKGYSGADLCDVMDSVWEAHGDRPAIRSTDMELTYSELSNAVTWLQERISAVLPERYKKQKLCVVLHMPNSVSFVEALLSLVRQRVPVTNIPAHTPKPRLEFIVKDVGASVMITTPTELDLGTLTDLQPKELCRITKSKLPMVDEDIVILQLGGEQQEGKGEQGKPKEVLLGSDCCYVTYTSGSTGDPKGVQCERSALLNMALGQITGFRLTQDDVTAQFASIGFDAIYSEIFASFLSGGTLAVIYCSQRLGMEFPETIAALGATLITLSASLLENYKRSDFPSLKKVISAGEACSKRVAQSWASAGDLEFFNAYGTVETTVCATVFDYTSYLINTKCEQEAEGEQDDLFPIGKAIPNVEVYLFDDAMNEVPVGDGGGEICVGGDGVSLGYIGHAENKTKDRFVAHPKKPGEIIYRTGDRATISSDGNLTFQGRVDDLVKIRGQTVNLMGVEWAIKRCQGVENASVVLHKVGQADPALAAFVSPPEMSRAILEEYLREHLPCHEIPTRIKMIDRLEMPRIPSGKIDKQMLARDESVMPFAAMPAQAERGPPLTDSQLQMAKIWCDVLNLDHEVIKNYTSQTTFIEAGANSLSIGGLQRTLRDTYKVKTKAKELLDNMTLESQAELFERRLPSN